MIITYQFIYHFHLFNSLIWVEFIEHSYIGSLTCISTNLIIILLVFYYFCLNSFFKFLLKYFLKNCFCKGISVVTHQFWFHLKMSLFCSLVKDNTEDICCQHKVTLKITSPLLISEIAMGFCFYCLLY